MLYYFLAPDTSEAAIKEALSGSLCPMDVAVIQADAASGVVSVETPGVWQADKLGREEGLGVPGWGFLEGVAPGTVKDVIEEGKRDAEKSEPIDVKVAEGVKG